ncbi:AMP-binding protein [Thauera sp. 27]|uniref:AMP-binding protein n=1 Tax=Thauera sp. 27 TaxID=305700 RepID=UPI0018DEE20C|nr:AMP-binding protein [Thauera sp. 27]
MRPSVFLPHAELLAPTASSSEVNLLASKHMLPRLLCQQQPAAKQLLQSYDLYAINNWHQSCFRSIDTPLQTTLTAMYDPTSDSPRTLPAWLEQQAERRSDKVALRHKRDGIWHERTWAELGQEVHALAGGLQRHGFGVGARLVIISAPRPEALLISIAAQHLGGCAALIEPSVGSAGQHDLLSALAPDYVFAEGRDEIGRVLAAGLAPALLVYADGRGLRALGETAEARSGTRVAPRAYGELIDPGSAGQVSRRTIANQAAFALYRRDDDGEIHVLPLPHDELLRNAQALLLQESLTANEEAFAARAFAASGQARYLVAPWLLAGFRLNYPENLGTRDNDRREIGPTLVLGTRATYQRLEHWVNERLPRPGSALRRMVDWALAPDGGALRRTLGHWLVRRPLRDVIGFTRTRVPLIVGEALPEASQRFFATLGIVVRTLPEPARWQRHPSHLSTPTKAWIVYPSSTQAAARSGNWEPA